MDPHLAELEGIYRALVQDIYARHAPGCVDIADTHGEAAGASLAFTRTAYLDVGGFDDCLPSANWLVRQACGKTLGPWPPHVPARFRLHVQDLPRHIEILENFENSERLISASIVRAAATPCSHLGMPAPDKGSAIALADSDPQTCRAPEERMSVTTQTNGSAIPTAKGA